MRTERGFYLFEDTDTPETNVHLSKEDTVSVHSEDEEELWEGGKDTPVHIVIVSLWYWWREVVFISLLTAFIFHMIVTRQVINRINQVVRF